MKKLLLLLFAVLLIIPGCKKEEEEAKKTFSGTYYAYKNSVILELIVKDNERAELIGEFVSSTAAYSYDSKNEYYVFNFHNTNILNYKRYRAVTQDNMLALYDDYGDSIVFYDSVGNAMAFGNNDETDTTKSTTDSTTKAETKDDTLSSLPWSGENEITIPEFDAVSFEKVIACINDGKLNDVTLRYAGTLYFFGEVSEEKDGEYKFGEGAWAVCVTDDEVIAHDDVYLSCGYEIRVDGYKNEDYPDRGAYVSCEGVVVQDGDNYYIKVQPEKLVKLQKETN